MENAKTRRQFLMTSAAVTAANSSHALGANDRIRIGVIGTGNRGKYLMREAAKQGGGEVEWVAVCDVYTWKLLRRDAGLSRRQTELALFELLEPMLEGR